MAVICSTYVAGNLIRWERNKGSVEHSTLFGALRDGRSFGRVYDDACDIGFAIHGKHETVVFACTHIEIDDENDVRWWLLESLGKNGRVDKRFTIQVWND